MAIRTVPNSFSSCNPHDLELYISRLSTFSCATWFNKPETLSPIECARSGFINSSIDTLCCVTCHNTFTWDKQSSIFMDANDLAFIHHRFCPWRCTSVSLDIIGLSGLSVSPPMLIFSYKNRKEKLQSILHGVPLIKLSAVTRYLKDKSQRYKDSSFLKSLHLSAADKQSYFTSGRPANDWSFCALEDCRGCLEPFKLLSLFGWNYEGDLVSETGEVEQFLKCHHCLRQVTLSLFSLIASDYFWVTIESPQKRRVKMLLISAKKSDALNRRTYSRNISKFNNDYVQGNHAVNSDVACITNSYTPVLMAKTRTNARSSSASSCTHLVHGCDKRLKFSNDMRNVDIFSPLHDKNDLVELECLSQCLLLKDLIADGYRIGKSRVSERPICRKMTFERYWDTIGSAIDFNVDSKSRLLTKQLLKHKKSEFQTAADAKNFMMQASCVQKLKSKKVSGTKRKASSFEYDDLVDSFLNQIVQHESSVKELESILPYEIICSIAEGLFNKHSYSEPATQMNSSPLLVRVLHQSHEFLPLNEPDDNGAHQRTSEQHREGCVEYNVMVTAGDIRHLRFFDPYFSHRFYCPYISMQLYKTEKSLLALLLDALRT